MHQPEHAPRTLFVDDESINQQIAAEILIALGAEADTADNGLQALRLIRTRHYAIVFTDVEMPVMDGATLTHILRNDSRYGELPIIACTAISSREEEEALLKKGFTAVLPKPFDVQAIQTALTRYATCSGEEPTPPAPASAPRFEEGYAIRQELERLPGFSVRQGLDRVMGNLPLYVSLLFDFRRELAEEDAAIRQARLRGDMPSIRASVHKLKGISGNIGATELYARLVELEPRLQGVSAESAGNLLDTLYGYVTTTSSVLAAAEQTIAVHSEVSPTVAADSETPDLQKLQPMLCECLLLVRQYNTAAREAFELARPFLGGQCRAEANEIQHAIDAFDFEKAESGLLHLAQLLDLELREPNGLS